MNSRLTKTSRGNSPEGGPLAIDQPSSRYTDRMPDEDQLSLRQADQLRGDLYAIQDDLDFIKVQLARLPTKNEGWGCSAERSLPGR